MIVELGIVYALVIVLSVVQSIFGMGLLVFGTPSLLLLGFDFISTLTFLLPSSFAISLLQVMTAGAGRKKSVSSSLYTLCLPCIGFGLWVAGATSVGGWINPLIGFTLVATAVIRLKAKTRRILSDFFHEWIKASHAVMGIIHGLTNLGGGLLVLFAGSVNTEKQHIRYVIAHYYLAFSIIQLAVLGAIMEQHSKIMEHIALPVIASLVYFLVGDRIFLRVTNPHYDGALTAFIALYGAIILFTF